MKLRTLLNCMALAAYLIATLGCQQTEAQRMRAMQWQRQQIQSQTGTAGIRPTFGRIRPSGDLDLTPGFEFGSSNPLMPSYGRITPSGELDMTPAFPF